MIGTLAFMPLYLPINPFPCLHKHPGHSCHAGMDAHTRASQFITVAFLISPRVHSSVTTG